MNNNNNNNYLSSNNLINKPKLGISPNHKSLKEYKLTLKELSHIQ
jgi:hypothetical protein